MTIMSNRYHLVEPIPSYATTATRSSKSSTSSAQPYIHTARGGAGNITRVPLPPNALRTCLTFPISQQTPPPSAISTRKHSTISSGRGGAGNIRTLPPSPPVTLHPREHGIFSLDEELEAQLRHHRTRTSFAPVYHVGRGGAGNTSSRRRLIERAWTTGDDAVLTNGNMVRRASTSTGGSSDASSDRSVRADGDEPGTGNKNAAKGLKRLFMMS